ncbi:unnamed protein product, partial [Symbiodinium sp. KB8]
LCSAGGCGFLPVAAGSSDCLAVGTCLRDFFQVGGLPSAGGCGLLRFAVGWLRSTGGRELLPVAAATSLCLSFVTSLRAFFQAGFLPVAAILLLPGPRSAVSSLEGHGEEIDDIGRRMVAHNRHVHQCL